MQRLAYSSQRHLLSLFPVSNKVGGHNCLIGIGEKSFHWALRSSLDSGADVIIRGTLLQDHCQVYHRHIRSRNSKSHSSQLPIQLRDDLPDSLCRSGRRWNDVLGSTTSSTP